jgi:hypothetical protein
MPERGMEKLHSLLVAEGRELVNIKFFPGSDRGLTADQLAEAAQAALAAALNSELVDNPPVSGQAKSSI